MVRQAALITSLLLVSLQAPAFAQSRAKAAKPPAAVTITNARAGATMTDFGLTDAEGKVIARLAKPLASGKSASLKLGKGAKCVMTAIANFDDMTDSTSGDVDVCKDKVVRFTD
ncbi:MAG TPA: hypothetical protein PLQ11_04510 [Beijerinckiaceae bacterium]|nr:hypothetical protein [Beijerinckiaceae bacterium]